MIGANRDRIAGRVRAAQTPITAATAMAARSISAICSRPGGTFARCRNSQVPVEQHHARPMRCRTRFRSSPMRCSSRSRSRAHHQDLGRFAGEQAERRQVAHRIARQPRAERVAETQLRIVGADHPRARAADHAKGAEQHDDDEPPADAGDALDNRAQPPARCTVKIEQRDPDNGDDDVQERKARSGTLNRRCYPV